MATELDHIRRGYEGKKVLVTGHSGFKGAWLVFALSLAGAQVYGFSKAPPIDPRHAFFALRVGDKVRNKGTQWGDVRDYDALFPMFEPNEKFDFVFHLAAQPLVSEARTNSRETFETNIMGTTNIIEANLRSNSESTMILITSDKAYLNLDGGRVFREDDELGGVEPYSGSKAAAELVIASYSRSYPELHRGGMASARAGNVFGGGDWSPNRLMPDLVRGAFEEGKVIIRKPEAVRPWTHVLDILEGYLRLGLSVSDGSVGSGQAWNFASGETREVREIAGLVASQLGAVVSEVAPGIDNISEPLLLQIESQKARNLLAWAPREVLDLRLTETVGWYKAQADGEDMHDYTSQLAWDIFQ